MVPLADGGKRNQAKGKEADKQKKRRKIKQSRRPISESLPRAVKQAGPGARKGIYMLKKFEALLKAVELGNLTEAGEELGYTQSGMSHMMKSLEAEFGFPLLVRNRNGVRWTSEGKRVAPILREMMNWNEKLVQEAASIRGVERGNIDVGTFTSVSIHWLPQILRTFMSEHPNINIHIRESGMQEMEELLLEKEIDLAFVSYQAHQSFDWIPICEDPLVAVLPQDYAGTCGDGPFSMENFEGKPFIMSAMGFDYDIHRALETSGVHPDIRFTSTDDYAILSMVANGLGLSVLPQLIVRDQPFPVAIKELYPRHSRMLGVALPSVKEASPAVKKFIECIRKVLLQPGGATPCAGSPDCGIQGAATV